MKEFSFWWERGGHSKAHPKQSEDAKKSQKQLKQLRDYQNQSKFVLNGIKNTIQNMWTKLWRMAFVLVVLLRPIDPLPI